MEEQMNQQGTSQQQAQPEVEVQASPEDVDKNKPFAIIGYIIPILFFVPLVSEEGKKSPFAKFHANQQLNLLLFAVVGWVASSILVFALIGLILMPLVWIASLVFMILGIVNAAGGKMKKLPLIGSFALLK